MSIKLKTVVKRNPLKPEDVMKFYLVQQKNGVVNLHTFAKEIAQRSSLVTGDVDSVLRNFVELMPLFLQLGYSVQLGSLGTCRISVRSNGKENPDELTAKDVKGVKVVFLPSRELKGYVSNLQFEKID